MGDATGVPRMDSPPTVSPKFFHSHRHTYPMGQTNVPADIFLLHIDIGIVFLVCLRMFLIFYIF